jgi:hypothetical protein
VSNLGRVAITAVAALLVGAIAYANVFDLHDTTLGTILYSSALTRGFFVLPFLMVAVVNLGFLLRAVALFAVRSAR